MQSRGAAVRRRVQRQLRVMVSYGSREGSGAGQVAMHWLCIH